MECISRLRFFRYFPKTYMLNSSQVLNRTTYLCHYPFRQNDILNSPSISLTHLRSYAKKAQGKKGSKQKLMQLTDEEMSQVINVIAYKEDLKQVQEKLKMEFIQNLSLRSSANYIDNLIVKLDDVEYPLHELAQISKKNPQLVAINMIDFPDALKPTIQAILDSGSGVNPQQDGTMIYVQVPKLTREHRENLAKNAKMLFVKAKEEVRSIQNYFVKEAKSKSELSEDLVFSTSNQIMAIAEQACTDLEKILKTKQKELLGES